MWWWSAGICVTSSAATAPITNVAGERTSIAANSASAAALHRLRTGGGAVDGGHRGAG